jgi:hypothetical protein
LVLEDHVVGAQSDLELLFFGSEFLLGQFPGDPVGLSALVVGLDGANGVLDLQENLLLLALESYSRGGSGSVPRTNSDT